MKIRADGMIISTLRGHGPDGAAPAYRHARRFSWDWQQAPERYDGKVFCGREDLMMSGAHFRKTEQSSMLDAATGARRSTPHSASGAIHATAVAIGGRALLIRGPSKAGKSSLALALMSATAPSRAIVLIGDDRVILSPVNGTVAVSPHPLIAGMIEHRGYGILTRDYISGVILAGAVDLQLGPHLPQSVVSERKSGVFNIFGKNYPSLHFGPEKQWNGRCQAVLEWFTATLAAHPAGKIS